MAGNAATSKWMIWLARLGYAVKGLVYLIIGLLAVQLAVGGSGGKVTDQKGALQTISDLPFGKFLMVVVTIGLIGFALWCFIQAIFDTEGKGKDAKGIIARLGYAVVGVAYASIAYGAFQFLTMSQVGGKGSTANTQDWTATLLKQPFGVALVVIVGLIVIGVAFYLFAKAYTAKFQNRLDLSSLSAQVRKWIIYTGRFGYASLGVVFTIIGIFIMVAAFQHNASKAKGLDGALQELAHQFYGPLLLGIVALGLVAYGVYSFVEARYRRVGR
ncbi:MAG: DUF1206 domain-containing protein [Ktedonobacteraceae bacterium]